MASSLNKTLTKHTNRGFQIRKQQSTTAEQEKALREQLHAEIELKSKACSNIVYDCTLPRVEGYDYCLKHILQDPKAPYKQCTYLYPSNGKRCGQPAPKYDPKKDIFTNFCFEHSRHTQIKKTKENIGKFKNIETNESLLKGLSHHINVEAKSSNNSISYNDSGDSDIDISRPYVDPYVDIKNVVNNDKGRHILDYASDSSGQDEDIPIIFNTWHNHDLECSDNESIDSQNDDLLKHAGIYTTEEATMITKQKMIRLRTLYMNQIHQLQHLLREKRRQYVHSLKAERESLCSIHNQSKGDPAERILYDKLKALNKFHKRTGFEAILHRKYIDKRAKITEGFVPKTPFSNKCIYTEGGVKCGDRIVPSSKHCRKHILEDKRQVLFRSCGVEKGGLVCEQPVPNIFENSTCALHFELPPQRSYTQKKYESDSEDDEITGGAPANHSATLTVKKDEPIPTTTTTIVSLYEPIRQQHTPQPSTSMTTTASLVPSPRLGGIMQSDDIDMFCSEDVGTNVTISHEQTESSMEDLHIEDSDNSNLP